MQPASVRAPSTRTRPCTGLALNPFRPSLRSTSPTYACDGEGRRVKKGSTVFVYDATGRLAAEYGGTSPATGTQYLTQDHLGSTRLVTSATGAEVTCYDYEPFGQQLMNGLNGRPACFGSDPGADAQKMRFTGKERDSETAGSASQGLDYFGTRYFSAAQGRFTSPDPVNAGARIRSPQSWNMYAYTLNNPLRYVDPTGMWPRPIHNQIIDKAFPGLSRVSRETLKAVSLHQDSPLTGQSRHGSFKHAMRSPSQTPVQARAEFEKYVADKQAAAQAIQAGSVQMLGETDPKVTALLIFGQLLHAVTDQTSPAHEGFQSWDWRDWCGSSFWGCDPDSVGTHTGREDWAAFTPARENQAIAAARQSFLATFGAEYFWYATRNSTNEPRACVEVFDSATGKRSKQGD